MTKTIEEVMLEASKRRYSELCGVGRDYPVDMNMTLLGVEQIIIPAIAQALRKDYYLVEKEGLSGRLDDLILKGYWHCQNKTEFRKAIISMLSGEETK